MVKLCQLKTHKDGLCPNLPYYDGNFGQHKKRLKCFVFFVFSYFKTHKFIHTCDTRFCANSNVKVLYYYFVKKMYANFLLKVLFVKLHFTTTRITHAHIFFCFVYILLASVHICKYVSVFQMSFYFKATLKWN